MLRTCILSGLLVAAILGMPSGPLAAQLPVRSLGEIDASFPEAFSLIRGVREMPDGRLMIADPLGQALTLVDMESGTSDTLGAVGQGPGEYRQPDGVFPLTGDSTLFVDLGNSRLTVIGPNLSFGATMPIAQSMQGMGRLGLLIVMPQAVDGRGALYLQPFGAGPGGAFPDSSAVVRYDRVTGTIDTVTLLKRPELKRTTSGSGDNQSVSIRQIPLSPQDDWAVAMDGRLAAVRSDDYHLEWIKPDGSVVVGERVDYRPVPIKRAEQEEWVEASANGLSVEISINDGQRQMSFSRGGGGGRSEPDIDNFDWPAVKPPFVAGGVWVTPEGDAWVERSVAAGEPRRFDVFGEDANLRAQIVLPAGRQVVGFGEGTVYLVLTDEFGLQYLERYSR